MTAASNITKTIGRIKQKARYAHSRGRYMPAKRQGMQSWNMPSWAVCNLVLALSTGLSSTTFADGKAIAVGERRQRM